MIDRYIMNNTFSPEQIRQKKFIILIAGVILYFLTSMAKVLIPASIFNDLQQLGFDARIISAMGAAYMYAYAASQLLAGIFSDRYGGVRILLTGGSMFFIGTIGFPLTDNAVLMILCRIAAGFGSGTVFLGTAKLLNDLFSKKFTLVLGTVLFIGYCGPTTGTMPMTKLIQIIGWRQAMMLPGYVTGGLLLTMLIFMRGTIKPVMTGQTFKPLLTMVKNFPMWMVCISGASVFGAYYVLLSQIGQKSIVDFCKVSPSKAAFGIMILTIIVAVHNMGVNFLLKLVGNRRKVVAYASLLCSAAGGFLGFMAFSQNPSYFLVWCAFLLIAIPAGFFPLFCTSGKELTPPENIGMAVAWFNFWCFVLIASYQNVTGKVLQLYSVSGQTAYPPEAYAKVFSILGILSVIGFILTFFYPETGKNNNK